MDFLQFREKLYKILSAHVKVQLSGTLRMEPVSEDPDSKRGFIYVPENGAIAIALYAEDVYEFYQDGRSICEIAEKMAEAIHQYLGVLDTKDTKELTKPENIIPELIPTAGNESFLKTVPHIPMEDIQIIFKFAMPEFADAVRVIVPMAYMERRGWDEKKLLEIARNNSKYKNDIRLIPLEPLDSVMPDEVEKSRTDDMSFLQDLSEKMVIVTNSEKFRGAAAILDEDLMATIAEAFQDDLCIIPSSIHECILVAKDQRKLEELRIAVYEVNREAVSQSDRLSDNIYFYDRVTKEITMISGPKDKTKQQGPRVNEPQKR